MSLKQRRDHKAVSYPYTIDIHLCHVCGDEVTLVYHRQSDTYYERHKRRWQKKPT